MVDISFKLLYVNANGVGSCGNSVFSYVRNHQAAVHLGCSVLHPASKSAFLLALVLSASWFGLANRYAVLSHCLNLHFLGN